MCALINGTQFALVASRSLDPLLCLALLYTDTRHWIWYLASNASPVLSLIADFGLVIAGYIL